MAEVLPDRINVLLVGSGGREHALAWCMRRSRRLGALWCEKTANAGIQALCTACPEDVAATRNFHFLQWLTKERIGLVVIGPEAPLEAGLADAIATTGVPVFGPVQAGARLEGDKAFAKDLMRQASVPTAEGKSFTSMDAALHYVLARDQPMVVKAAGLCAGKGVVVCDRGGEAAAVIRRMMGAKEFGDAGAKVVIEEKLDGQELSVLALVDGSTISLLEPCQDHKQVGEGDTGANTGGMGAYCPTPLADEATMDAVVRDVLVPTVDALKRDGIPFCGVLYAGLMLTPAGPKVLEFNTRFGDPETQPLMMRFQGDLVETLWRCATGSLDEASFTFDPRVAVCVAVCAEGYPGTPRKGDPINGIPAAEACAGDGEEVVVFHAGTTRRKDGTLVTNGGRVLGVTALAATLERAQALANQAARCIEFPGAFFRSDIGHRVLKTASSKA
jgi:phosphoribosylamine--glycine ligase